MKKHIYCQHSFKTEVPFFDVDAMHIVWHGNYVKYLETARCAF
ncbi:acyl-CoA thioesterase, partial [Neisseria sp. P0009.S007]